MTGLKISQYTRICQVSDDVWFVHNLASGAECIIDKQELNCLNNLSSANEEMEETISQWCNLGIVVDSQTDEESCLELERKLHMYSSIKELIGVVIAPTMDCNARCFYCYENNTRSSCYMSREVELQVIAYIKKMAKEKNRLFVSWFGGEPLICFEQILRITDELISFCKNNSIEYEAELTTNGYLIDSYKERLHQLCLSDIQITLDGFKDEHEKRKDYINCPNSWQKTIDNILDLSLYYGQHITIRMNFDRDNVDGIIQTTNYIIEDNRWNNNIAIYYYPLEPIDEKSNFSYYKEEEYSLVMERLYNNLYCKGYYANRKKALEFHKLSLPCYGGSLSTTAIDYEGNIYHCQHLLCRSEMAIGNVYTGIIINNETINWYDGTLPKECKGCEVLPLCQGGCVTKRRLGQRKYLCHMMKYRLDIQERIKIQILKEQYKL